MSAVSNGRMTYVWPKERSDKRIALTSSQTRANDFEGAGGPEDKVGLAERDRTGDNDVTGTNR